MKPEEPPTESLLQKLRELGKNLAQTEALLPECREASESLRESEERCRSMVQAVEDYAIFMLDVQGHIVSLNQGGQSINGYAPNDVLGRSFSFLYPEEGVRAGRPERVIQEAMENGRVADQRRLV
jgi:PAS domain-containing protein